MNAVVVYESIFGNTRAVAEAIGQGLGEIQALPVAQAAARTVEADLLVVGGPTHMHGIASARTRQMAVAAAEEDGEGLVEPGAAEGPGLRGWLRDLPHARSRAATFDTRLDRSPWLTGVAARGIARRLQRHGYDVVGTLSFLVQDAEGPLERGELVRARAWGEELARLFG